MSPESQTIDFSAINAQIAAFIRLQLNVSDLVLAQADFAHDANAALWVVKLIIESDRLSKQKYGFTLEAGFGPSPEFVAKFSRKSRVGITATYEACGLEVAPTLCLAILKLAEANSKRSV